MCQAEFDAFRRDDPVYVRAKPVLPPTGELDWKLGWADVDRDR